MTNTSGSGHARFGFRFEEGQLVRDEEEQAIVRRVLTMRQQDPPVSFQGIAGTLNSEKVFMRGRYWSPATVRSVVRYWTEAGLATSE